MSSILDPNTQPNRWFLYLGAFSIFVLSATSITFGYLYLKQSTSDPQQQLQSTLSQVSKLILLPDETPELATVTEKEKLAQQPFFSKAENGDQVLLFKESKKIYLYRPSENKLINVDSISVANTQDQTASLEPEAPTSTPADNRAWDTVLLNGTATVGLTRKFETELEKKQLPLVVTDKQNAVNAGFTQTTVYVLSNEVPTQVIAQLTTEFSAIVEEWPAAQQKPKGDIAIVVGSDWQAP